MSIKIKVAFLVMIMASLLLFVCVGAMMPAYAETPVTEQTIDTGIEPTAPETDENEEDDALSIEAFADRFKSYLISKFGEDYEFYYNQIIEQWGSVEGYLLAFGEKLPEKQQSGWDNFVGWLRDYWPVWATALALAIIITIAVLGKKLFVKIVERIANAKLSPIAKELILQSNAITALIRSQKALLGSSEKFAENVKALEEADEELNNG